MVGNQRWRPVYLGPVSFGPARPWWRRSTDVFAVHSSGGRFFSRAVYE